ncbi:nuclear receptor binding factor 2a [Chanos chanos]|uniref:Nuclear receptor binding factor 2a n=1 Tax=Chanos chanos TaxID=29144 RepID=A0A6J2WCV9_CHACN|nr:nuclear receptor-binding factor 2-like [Chanos chanos]
MEVMDGPLNRAHQCGRKADRLLAQEKYEEAMACHGEAADLLWKALQITQCEQVQLSLELQRVRHVQQQRQIQESLRRARLSGKPVVNPLKPATSLPPTPPPKTISHPPASPPVRPPMGSKAVKDDKTRLEEQSTAIADLRKLVVLLLVENEHLLAENVRLKLENAHLRREPYVDQQSPHLTLLPQETEPVQNLSVPPLPLLHLPPELQVEIQELWDRE